MGWQEKINALHDAGIGIYDNLPSRCLFLSDDELRAALSAHLIGLSLAGLPLRTRSKVLKTEVCRALRLQPPSSFKKCQPRFPNQDFDTYIQKSANLQIWNEEISPTRRYVIIQLSSNDIITAIRVIRGSELAILDTTGTLTQKYQARVSPPVSGMEVFSNADLLPVAMGRVDLTNQYPLDPPSSDTLMPLQMMSELLLPAINHEFSYQGADQERNRGGNLHELVCSLLGYSTWADDGQFPDIKNQLLELKLQTSPTIDLGLYSPADSSPTDLVINGHDILHDEVRYGVFIASVSNGIAKITGVALGYGRDFYTRFPQFQGRVVNRKIQIPLPANFFDC